MKETMANNKVYILACMRFVFKLLVTAFFMICFILWSYSLIRNPELLPNSSELTGAIKAFGVIVLMITIYLWVITTGYIYRQHRRFINANYHAKRR